ncbi:hypothetical protein N2152v2_005998 [Parachlorella kessleri]
MQRLRHSLLAFARLEYVTAPLIRVDATYQPTALTSLRQHSTATAKQIGQLDKSDPNYLQQLKAILRPENSGRNEFHRKWQKNLLKTWNDRTRKENEAAARLRREAERKERWAKRAEFKKAAAEQQHQRPQALAS